MTAAFRVNDTAAIDTYTDVAGELITVKFVDLGIDLDLSYDGAYQIAEELRHAMSRLERYVLRERLLAAAVDCAHCNPEGEQL
jgi:hypothetical protein